MCPDGQWGWYAFPPEGRDPGADDDRWEGPDQGSRIRFMSEVCVDVPLRDDDLGLIFSDGEELRPEWG